MKFERPQILGVTVGLLIGALVAIILSVAAASTAVEIRFVDIFLTSLVTFLAAMFIVKYAVELFVYNKVKIIYKNIHDLKVGGDEEESQVVRSTDLEMVTREVSEWAEQRRSEIQDLRERENFRREFIGNISHELKTPIFNIQGYLLTLLDGALDDPEINRKYLKRANKSVDRMINIIEDLEVISDLETDRVQLNLSNYDIVRQVREVFELLESPAKKRQIKFSIKNETERPQKVRADEAKIEQVLINLISNAIKYGKVGGKVAVEFFDMDTNILIEISDDGVGIPEEDVSRVFERFYRVDKSRSREAGGTGLGLSIVKHIVEAHKQTINVRSREELGSTFSFTLKKGK